MEPSIRYETNDPADGRIIEEYNDLNKFLEKHTMFKSILSEDREKFEMHIHVEVPDYPLIIDVVYKPGE